MPTAPAALPDPRDPVNLPDALLATADPICGPELLPWLRPIDPDCNADTPVRLSLIAGAPPPPAACPLGTEACPRDTLDAAVLAENCGALVPLAEETFTD